MTEFLFLLFFDVVFVTSYNDGMVPFIFLIWKQFIKDDMTTQSIGVLSKRQTCSSEHTKNHLPHTFGSSTEIKIKTKEKENRSAWMHFHGVGVK